MTQLLIVAGMSICVACFSAFAAGPCETDVAYFCQGTEDVKQVIQCLKQNKDQLSLQCKTNISAVLEAVKEAHQDCETEIYVFCQGVPLGGGRIVACLTQNKGSLSYMCKAGLFDLMTIGK